MNVAIGLHTLRRILFKQDLLVPGCAMDKQQQRTSQDVSLG